MPEVVDFLEQKLSGAATYLWPLRGVRRPFYSSFLLFFVGLAVLFPILEMVVLVFISIGVIPILSQKRG